MRLPHGIVLVSCTILPLPAQGSHWKAHDGWAPRSDKVLHFGAGAFAGGTAYAVARECGASPRKAWFTATVTALAVGILKERYDSHKGGWRDPADAAYTGAGGFVFGCAVYRSDPDRPKRFATAPPPLESLPVIPQVHGPCCPEDPE